MLAIVIFAAGLSLGRVHASEITGTLSSGSAPSQSAQSDEGSISGDVRGGSGSSTAERRTTSSGGGGSVSSAGSGTVTQAPIAPVSNALIAQVGIPPSIGGGVAEAVSTTSPDQSDQGTFLDTPIAEASETPLGLAANAGGAVSLGTKAMWAILGVLALLLGYVGYRRYARRAR